MGYSLWTKRSVDSKKTDYFKAAEHDLVAVFHRPQQIIFNFFGSFVVFSSFDVISR